MLEQKSIVLAQADEDRAIQAVKILSNIIVRLRAEVFKENVDWGIIPGTGDKPSLLLPGMEKIMRALNAVPEYIERCVIRDYVTPLFHYEYECRLIDADTGVPIPGGRGLGLCNSMESSFKWRWVQEHELPPGIDKTASMKRGGKTSEFGWAIDKGETTGKYAKPIEYWQMFRDAIQNGTATAIKKPIKSGELRDAWEMDTTVYRILNPDIFDQANAIIKRAKKRALGDACKGAANVSEFFTVDLEDFERFDNVVEGTFTEVSGSPEGNSRPLPKTTPTEAATQPEGDSPPPSGTTETGTPWATEDSVNTLIKYASSKLGTHIGDIQKYTGIQDVNDYAAWDAKYATRADAGAAIKAAYDKEQADLEKNPPPPATPKNAPAVPAHQWTDEEAAKMDASAALFYDPVMMQPLDPQEALRLIGKTSWKDFGDPTVAFAALRTMCIEKVMPIIATSAGYMISKHSVLANGILEVRRYGLREELAKLGDEWEAYTETWEKKQSYMFAADEMPNLVVHWKFDDKNNIVANEIKVLDTEIAF